MSRSKIKFPRQPYRKNWDEVHEPTPKKKEKYPSRYDYEEDDINSEDTSENQEDELLVEDIPWEELKRELGL